MLAGVSALARPLHSYSVLLLLFAHDSVKILQCTLTTSHLAAVDRTNSNTEKLQWCTAARILAALNSSYPSANTVCFLLFMFNAVHFFP